jgi:excisionase family DNA binding protein
MESTKKSSELIGTTEAARILRVGDNTLRRWVREGRIKPEQRLPSGYLRFNRAEVNRLLEEMRVR